MGVLWGVVAVSKRSGGSGMRLCGATGLAQPRLIGRLLRSSGPSPACPPAKCLPVAGQQAGDSVLGICPGCGQAPQHGVPAADRSPAAQDKEYTNWVCV